MSEELNKQADEDLVKSLAEELDMPEEEIKSLLKSDDTGKKEEEEEEEVEKGKKKPEIKKSELGNLPGMSEEDIKKSISSLMGELKTRKSGDAPKIEKSDNNDLIKSLEDNLTKSFTDSLGEIKKGFEKSVENLTGEITGLKETIEAIGENSQGVKGVDFGFISKSGDDSPTFEEGKTILSPKDRESISNKLFEIIEKSTDENLIKSASVDLINYQGSGEISKNMLSTLNSNDVFFREQIKK